MPVAFNWYHELSWIKEYRFPLDQGSKTVYECLKDWLDDYNGHIATTTFLTAEEKAQIRGFSDNLLQSHKLYIDNRYIDAFNTFNQAMDSVKAYLMTVRIGRKNPYVADAVPYYRIIAGNNGFTRLQFLHLPCTARYLASSNRFSVPGMPCSYMASMPEVSWYECGMPDSFQMATFMAVKHEKLLLQLDVNPLTSTVTLLNQFQNNDWSNEVKRIFAKKYCFIFPLVAVCSVIAKEKGKAFVEAYIIPQMLMIWVKNSTDYVGVRYYSSSDNELVRDDCGYNIAMPAKHPDANGYCTDLQDIFGIDASNKNEVIEFLPLRSKFYDHHGAQIEELEDFYKRILYKRQHTHYEGQATLYKHYCSICRVLIALIKAFRTENGSSKYALVMSLSEAWDLCRGIQRLTKEDYAKIRDENCKQAEPIPDDILHEMEDDMSDFYNKVVTLAQDFYLFATVGIT